MAKNKQKDTELDDFLLEDDKDLEPATRVSFEIDPFSGVISNESGPGLEKEYVKGLQGTNVDIEVDFEGSEEDDTPQVVTEDEDTTDEETEDTPPSTKVQVKDTSELEKKKNSRRQERIRQLAREKREAVLKAAQLEETLSKTNAIYAKIQIDNLEKGIENLKKELQVAVENQDAEAIASVNSKYMETYQQLSDYRKFLPDAEKASLESKAKIENFDKEYKDDLHEDDKEDTVYPEAAQLWMEGKEFIWDINTYKKLPLEQRKKIYPIRAEMQRILEDLIRKEGFTPDDEALYDEVDLRLSSKFPEYDSIASKGISALNSEKTPPKKSPSGETTKPRNVEDKTRSVPVKGSSSIGSSEHTKANTSKIKLTKEDVAYYERYLQPRGITLQEYAKQIKNFNDEQ